MINTKSSIDPNELRKLFPIFAKRSLVYLDSAATSQKPEIVISTVKKFYDEYNSNVHRSIYDISQEATEAYEISREKIAKFLNCLLYTSPSPRDVEESRMPSSA